VKTDKTEHAEELATLREWIKPGDTVYTILEHRSPSGMSRWIRVLLLKVDDKGKPYAIHPNHAVGVVLGLRRGAGFGALGLRPADHKREGVFISGCGMDMGFEIVYRLGCALWPDGTPEPHGMRNGELDRDGGYALKHQWL
jgi:hypothetical protein